VILAYHIILSAYGFWLPNDPRGSWSEFVGAWELFRYGKATKVTTRRSVAKVPHDRARWFAAKRSLRYPPVRFSGLQARSIATGFGRAAHEGEYVILACAILHDHVHLIITRIVRPISQVVAHLKGRTTQQLRAEGVHPFEQHADVKCNVPTVWAGRYWKVFIDNEEHFMKAIAYVEDNPINEGCRRQNWKLVTSLEDFRAKDARGKPRG
jgi:REP element-mobilizing transposase RayT